MTHGNSLSVKAVIALGSNRPASENSMTSESVPVVSAGARRMRWYRERRRRGLRCVTIQIRHSEVDALVTRRLLAPEERADRGALRQAIHRFLDMTLGRTW